MNETQPQQTLLDVNLTHEGDPDRARRIIRRFNDFEFDFVHLPLYRTEYLVSSIHAPDQARWFRESELDFADVVSLRDAVREAGAELVCTVYDRDLLNRYREEFSPAPVFLDPGDLTFHRLLKQLENASSPVWIGLCPGSQGLAPERLKNRLEGILVRPPLHPDESPPLSPEPLDNLVSPEPGAQGYSASRGKPGWTATARERGCELLRFPLGPRAHQFPADTREPLETFLSELESADPSNNPPESSHGDRENQWSQYLRDCERSLMADRSLSAGSTLRADMVRELRPGGGLPAAKFDSCTNTLIPRPADPGEMIAYS